ncbi:hypothetical protein [Streptomyces sp. NPDC005573]|uniref:hypothetical protein n=1 Tax=Streptomyces sp. NPDC005573 TaxID=3156890 RepID=UPI0033AF6E9B
MAKEQERTDGPEILERCGLRAAPVAVPQEAPSVSAAVYAVTGFEVEPTVTVPTSSPRAGEILDREWHRCAAAAPLYDEKGRFLILPPVSGGSETGWIAVTDPGGEDLPSRVAAATGSPEFIAASLDGRHLCAATVEDDDYWVVSHEFMDS